MNIRIRSVFVDVLKLCLLASKKRKVFILIFLAAIPLVILIWAGLFVSLAPCLFIGLSGLYSFFVPLFSSKPHIDYFALSLSLIGLASVLAFGSYLKWLRRSFNSGEVLLEQLLPIIGVILWLFGLIGVIIWLASAV